MSERDRIRWDERYAARDPDVDHIGPPDLFASHTSVFPRSGIALELACGQGSAAAWLAHRGLQVLGVDASTVAVDRARALARHHGVDDRARFEVADLDDGLPSGPPADVIVCHRFRDRRLDAAILGRLAPGGLLAISALSEVGAVPGCHRAAAGELVRAFGGLEIIDAGEAAGQTWLLGRHTSLIRGN